MAGDIIYLLYSLIAVIAYLWFAILFKRKKRAWIFLLFPLLILQFYFWNIGFNYYVKSYLAPSKSFACAYGGEWILPLPSRTVLNGKEDACSPFYITYVTKSEFNSFYENLTKNYNHKVEIKSIYHSNNGYVIEFLSGSVIQIDYIQQEGTVNSISIDQVINE